MKLGHAVGKNLPFGRKICSVQKTPQNFGVHESGLPDFGRLWTPNPWHQVIFSNTPKILRIWRFKWAMWKVGGIKIERTPLWYFFSLLVRGNWWKSEFFGETLCTLFYFRQRDLKLIKPGVTILESTFYYRSLGRKIKFCLFCFLLHRNAVETNLEMRVYFGRP